MKHPLLVAIGVGLLRLLVAGVAYETCAAESPLVVRVATDRPVYRLRRPVRITLTPEAINSSCNLHSGVWQWHSPSA